DSGFPLKSSYNETKDERGDDLRILILCIWSIVMFAFLFTFDLHGLISRGEFTIHFTASPTFRYFDVYSLSPELLLQKIGHTVMFGIWLLTLVLVMKNLKSAIFIAISIALFSDLIQPFFMSDGHLLDALFYSAWILFMAVFINVSSQVAK